MKSASKRNFRKVSFCTVHRDECKSVKKNNKCDKWCGGCGKVEEIYQYRQL